MFFKNRINFKRAIFGTFSVCDEMKLNDFFWPYGRIHENSLKLVAVSQTDEDFACIAVHSSKKSRTQLKDPKKEKKEKQKKPHNELTPSQKQTPSKR